MDLNLDASAAAWVQAGAVTIAVLVAVWQVFEARRTRRQEARAYVVVLFEVHPDRMSLPDLTIANLGRTAARNITVSYTPELRSHTWTNPKADAFFRGGIATLAPGQRLATIFDSMLERPKDWEEKYEAVVSYSDTFGKRHRETFVLDLATYRGLTYVDRKGVHHVHEQLKKLVAEIEHLRKGTGAAGPLPVRVQTMRARRREVEIRNRDEWRRKDIPHLVIWWTFASEWIRDEWKALRAWVSD